MVRFIFAIIWGVCGILSLPVYGQEEKPVLRIYNWSEYIDIDESLPETLPIAERSPTLLSFAEKFNCTVEYYEYDDTPEMINTIENIPGFYDVLVASVGDMENLINAKKIMALNKSLIPNLSNTYPVYYQFPFDSDGAYSAPYLVGTTGLLYRSDIVGYDVNSWKTLFHPDEQIKGKVNILDDSLLSFSIALQSIGADPNTQDVALIKKAWRLIYNLKKRGLLNSCTADIPEITSALIKGNIAITPMYSGNALSIIDKAPEGQLKYVIPNEGGEYYVDSFVALKDSKNIELAHAFINFMLSPEVHARNAVYLKYLCPNKEALPLIERDAPEQLRNPAIYFDDSVRDKLTIYNSTNSEIYRLLGKIFWNRIF